MDDAIAEKRYYITVGTTSIGPLSWTDINDNILKCRISINAQVFDEKTKSWTTPLKMLNAESGEGGMRDDLDPLEMQALRANKNIIVGLMPTGFKDKKIDSDPVAKGSPSTPPHQSAAATKTPANPATAAPVPSEKYWYLKQGTIVLGPYSFLMMIVFFRDGTIVQGDTVKVKGENQWIDAFQAFPQDERDTFEKLLPDRSITIPVSQVNEKRALPRKALEALVLLKFNDRQIVAQGYDISKTHLAILTLAPELNIRQNVELHIELPFGKKIDSTGTVERVSEVAAKTVTAKLIKYIIRLDKDADLSLIDN